MPIRTLPFLLSATLLLLVGAGRPTAAQDRTTDGTVALDAEGTVVVDNHEGRITIETWDRAEVQYEAVVRPEDDAEHPEATVVRVDRDDDRFAIRTEYDEDKESGGGSFWSDSQNIMPVEYTLTVPRTARIEVDDHESDIEVTGAAGRVRLDTHDGRITLTDQAGEADIESHDGPIRVENQSGALSIDTHDSDFTLTVPAGAGFDLRTDFDDEDADLRADFDLAPYRVSDDDDDEVNYAGSVNGGGPRISLSAHDGDFEIRTQ